MCAMYSAPGLLATVEGLFVCGYKRILVDLSPPLYASTLQFDNAAFRIRLLHGTRINLTSTARVSNHDIVCTMKRIPPLGY